MSAVLGIAAGYTEHIHVKRLDIALEGDMDPQKLPGLRIAREVNRAREMLVGSWRELMHKGFASLINHDVSWRTKTDSRSPRVQSWRVSPAEIWETAKFAIVRVEVPEMKKEDLQISIDGFLLRIAVRQDAVNKLKGRSFAAEKLEHTVCLPVQVAQKDVELSCEDGVVTVILRKPEAVAPPGVK